MTVSTMRTLAVGAAATAAVTLTAGCGGSMRSSPSATATQTSATATRTSATATQTSATTTQTTSPQTGGNRPGASRRASAAAWPTYHANLARTGVALAGPALGRARRLWDAPVDGAVYAEPLIAQGRVIVATENDSVYAFDLGSGRQAWRAHLGTPVPGGDLPCGNIDPSGITGTPTIDARSGIVYAVTFERSERSERFEHRLVALDLATGRVRWQRPIDPPGADPRTHQQRAALALSRGHVYVAYGGLYGDCGDYHGWVLGAPASGPAGGLLGYRVPTEREGAIWAPSGPAIDADGNVYVATGNGSSSSTFDFGNAVIRLTPALERSDFFAPSNAPAMSSADLDLGSTGPLLLPRSRAFIIGKTGVGYLLNTTRLGDIGHPVASRSICGAAFGGSAYADGTIYVPCTDGIVAVRVVGDQLEPTWRNGDAPGPPILAGPGLWGVGGQTLFQLDPRTGRERFSAAIGDPAHFATPAAGGGRIFVAAGEHVYAFG